MHPCSPAIWMKSDVCQTCLWTLGFYLDVDTITAVDLTTVLGLWVTVRSENELFVLYICLICLEELLSVITNDSSSTGILMSDALTNWSMHF